MPCAANASFIPVESVSVVPGADAAALRFAMYITFTSASKSDTTRKSPNGKARRVQLRRTTNRTPAVTNSSLMAENNENGGVGIRAPYRRGACRANQPRGNIVQGTHPARSHALQ